jgi:curved DNA-binding protein CbpA
MPNPYRVLNVPRTADDETVRRSYLGLIRRFPPQREPEAFKRIQAAYEAIRDLRARIRHEVFTPSLGESLEEWIEEIRAERRSGRLGLVALRRIYGLS